jgi:hypothetical protein
MEVSAVVLIQLQSNCAFRLQSHDMRTNSAGFVGRTGTVTEAAINSTQTHVSRTTPRNLTSAWGDTMSTSMFVCALTLAIQLTCATYVQSQQLEGRLLDRASAAEEQANAATASGANP